MLDFNNEQEQQTRNYGPVPAGSSVLVKIELIKSQYTDEDNEFVSKSKNGLLSLFVRYEVLTGTYHGVQWWENIWLPQGNQKIRLSEGQKTACNMGGAKIRAIIEACKGVNPKDDTPKAARLRQIQDWLDISGFEFPVTVGIDKKPYVKDGREFWNNTTYRIITSDKKDYRAIMDGGEMITDGPVVGKNTGQQHNAENSDPDAWRNDIGPQSPSEKFGSDEVPF